MSHLKRVLIIGGLIVGGILTIAVIVALAVNGYCSAQVRQELAEHRAQGYPITLAELAPAPVPDEENAAVEFNRAITLLPTETEEEGRVWTDEVPGNALQWPEDYAAAVAAYLDRRAEPLSHLDKALEKPRCVFVTDYSAGGFGLLVPHVREVRNCARMLKLRAGLALRDGDPDRALADTLRIWQVASLMREERTLISGLVGIACVSIGYDPLRTAVVEGKAGEALSPQALSLVLKEPRLTSPDVLLASEMCVGLDVFERQQSFEQLISSVGVPTGSSNLATRALRKVALWTYRAFFLRADELFYVRHLRDTIQISKGLLPEGTALLRAQDQRLSARKRFPFMLSSFILPAVSRVVQVSGEATARVRLARTGVAVELYRNEHGEYPESLAAIAAMVGEKNLEDPFGAALAEGAGGNRQAQFIYRREGDSYVLYSLGPNMTDNSGVEYVERQHQEKEGDMVWRGEFVPREQTR